MTQSPTDTADHASELDAEHPDTPADTGFAVTDRGPFPRFLPWLVLVGGGIGLLAAFVLTVERIALLQDPSYVPSCSINPLFSCGSVMEQPQAAVFGFPNPLVGIAGFGIVATIGAAILAGATFARWFWLGLQAGVLFGIGFVHWLIYQSLFSIGALCPYCMVVWLVMIPIFWYVTLHNLSTGALPVPRSLRGVVRIVTPSHGLLLLLWYLVIVALIGIRFADYWSSLL